MNKKAFTLIEMLAVITLLALLSMIIFPKILEIVDKNHSDVDDAKLDLIYSGADTYIAKHRNNYKENKGDVYCLSLNTLVLENVILTDISDIDNNKVVKIKVNATNSSYSLVEPEDCVNVGVLNN